MKLPVLASAMLLAFGAMASASAQLPGPAPAAKPFVWENATVYFLLTDRFNNGNPANDKAYGRKDDAAPLRGFMGGDIAGITALFGLSNRMANFTSMRPNDEFYLMGRVPKDKR